MPSYLGMGYYMTWEEYCYSTGKSVDLYCNSDCYYWCQDLGLDYENHRNRDLYYQAKHIAFLIDGKNAGWWEIGEGNNPIKLAVVKAEKCTSFPKLLADLGLFPSAKDAKRNGWNKPIEPGDYLFKKKTYVLRIV